MNLPDLDPAWWGSIPAWLGAGSLILAYIVFRRDRVNAERRQVDLLGAWATATYERRLPHEVPRVEECQIVGHIRNASELPIRIRQIAYRTETSWLVEDQEQSMPYGGPWTSTPGTGPFRSFQDDLGTVPPGETRSLPFNINVAHLAPADAAQLGLSDGVTPYVDWLLVVDNAGRKWDVRPKTGRRAKRVRRRWRPDEYMPRQW
jgi:hypothetical protein